MSCKFRHQLAPLALVSSSARVASVESQHHVTSGLIRSDPRYNGPGPGITGPKCVELSKILKICVVRDGNVKFAVSSSFLPHS